VTRAPAIGEKVIVPLEFLTACTYYKLRKLYASKSKKKIVKFSFKNIVQNVLRKVLNIETGRATCRERV